MSQSSTVDPSGQPTGQPAGQSAGPSPAHTALAVVFQVRAGVLEVLLWERARDPDRGAWSLPGGTLAPTETLEQSILRHLATKVDVREVAHLEQLGTWSDPARHPERWELATAYLGLVPLGIDPRVPPDTRWHAVDALPHTAFDHGAIVLSGRERLRGKLSYSNIGFALAPGVVHARRAARRVHGRPRLRGLRDEPEAGAATPRGHCRDRHAPRTRPFGRTARGALPLLHPPVRGHRSVRRAAATFVASHFPCRQSLTAARNPPITRRCGTYVCGFSLSASSASLRRQSAQRRSSGEAPRVACPRRPGEVDR